MDDDPDLYPYVSGYRGDMPRCDQCGETGHTADDHAQKPAPAPCPAWADGQHCYVDKVTTLGVAYGGQFGKRCACGKTVERAK